MTVCTAEMQETLATSMHTLLPMFRDSVSGPSARANFIIISHTASLKRSVTIVCGMIYSQAYCQEGCVCITSMHHIDVTIRISYHA